jgi:signal peptidase I
VAPDITDPTLVEEGTSAPDDGIGEGAENDPTITSPPTSHWVREIFLVVAFALAVALVLRLFVVQTFFIPSGSMEPTLQIGDRILVDKLAYHIHSVHRGDIVVFTRPTDENCGGAPVNDLVKRVIGLPGETISLAGGYVYINGKKLDETWLPASVSGVTRPGPPEAPADGFQQYNLTKPFVIPSNHFFVMGDNRTESCDSRYWGPIDRNMIVGKVDVRVWPLTSFHFF